MDTPTGLFFVIEGTDGSGKGTQYKLLAERLTKAGYDVAQFDFPQYDQPSSFFVKEYLNSRYGTAEEVGPYTASLFYALDRYQAAPQIREALAAGKIVLANRFVGSNMAHQGTNFANPEQRRGFFIWLDNLEYQMLGIPRPSISFVLQVPADIAQGLVDKKEERQYTSKKRDMLEADLSHLQRAYEVYDSLVKLFPKDFVGINCVKNEQLRSIPEVSNLLWERIKPLLPPRPSGAAKNQKPPRKHEGAMTKAHIKESPYVYKDDRGNYRPTKAGLEFLKEAVTSVNGDVYAFSEKLSPSTIAAAMARLSRRADDMRITILDEFAASAGQDEALLQRVITAYGDDSVQQLVGQHIVIENASNLLTKKLEHGRLAAYLEQSTRYIFFDRKDLNGRYRYHVPKHFNMGTKRYYEQSMDKLFALYSEVVQTLTTFIQDTSSTPQAERDAAWRSATKAQACDAARPMLPVAAKSTVGIFASAQALEHLIMQLLSDQLPEANITGKRILQEARKVMPMFLERADKPERGGALVAYRANTYEAMQKLAHTELSAHYTVKQDTVTLTDYWPRNEFDLVADMLYEHSDQPLDTIREEVGNWSYDKKVSVIKTYMGERLNRRHLPGRALEKAHYSFDIVCDYGIFRDLQRHRMVDDLAWQMLTPRYGYEIPEIIEKAGLVDLFEQAFDLSLEVHSRLQEAGYQLEAQYATLLGHRMRWKVTYNAREAFHIHELRTSPQGHPGYRKLVTQMHETIAGVHPLLSAEMRFVNTNEDAALTRLAAERYSQYKLKHLQNPDQQ